jgi:hypothetical protein
MTKGGAYNPLDKINLAKSIETELLVRPTDPLSAIDAITGAGVYVIYYTGAFPAYAPVAEANRDGKFERPIYIGKAIPKGGRKGGLSTEVAAPLPTGLSSTRRPSPRLTILTLRIFRFAISLLMISGFLWAKIMLIETFKPVWNRAIDGFGNKDPGNRRATQFRSPWDVLHPGRQFAKKQLDQIL